MNHTIVIAPYDLPAHLGRVVAKYFQKEDIRVLPVDEILEYIDSTTILFLVDVEAYDPRIIRAISTRTPLTVFGVGMTDWVSVKEIEHTHLDPLDPSVATKLTQILGAITRASASATC